MTRSLQCFVSLVLICTSILSFGQERKVYMNWDYKNAEKEKVFQVWKQYLTQKEYTDTLWSDTDRRKYTGIDLLKNAAGLGGYLYKIRFDCNVLSISEIGNNYLLKSAFYWKKEDTLQSGYINLFAIVNVIAVRVGNGYKLSNYINHTTATWNEKRVGKIVYHYPQAHAFDIVKATKANTFIDSLQNWFGFVADTVDYYIPMNCTDGFRMVGFEYYQSEGKELNLCGYYDDANNIIYSNSYAGEYYKHELVHLINLSFPEANDFLLAGLAAYIDDAGSLGKSEKVHIRTLLHHMKTHPLDLNNFMQVDNIDENTVGVYIFGAVICNAIMNKGGTALLKKALKENTKDNKRFLTYLRDTLDIKDFNEFFRKEFQVFLKQPNVLLSTENS